MIALDEWITSRSVVTIVTAMAVSCRGSTRMYQVCHGLKNGETYGEYLIKDEDTQDDDQLTCDDNLMII